MKLIFDCESRARVRVATKVLSVRELDHDWNCTVEAAPAIDILPAPSRSPSPSVVTQAHVSAWSFQSTLILHSISFSFLLADLIFKI